MIVQSGVNASVAKGLPWWLSMQLQHTPQPRVNLQVVDSPTDLPFLYTSTVPGMPFELAGVSTVVYEPDSLGPQEGWGSSG